MSKVRVYELARELDLESKILVDFLVELGADVRNHMSTIDEDIADLVREHYSPDEESVIPVKVLPDEEVPRQRKVKRRVVEEEVEKSYPRRTRKIAGTGRSREETTRFSSKLRLRKPSSRFPTQ